METNTIILLMFLLFLVLLFLQVPIALCLGFASIFFITQSSGLSMMQMATSMFSAVDSFPLMAVPLFILCGAIIDGGGLGKRLVNFCAAFVGQFTGGYAMVTVITCAFFGAISGSALATVAAIGGIMLPVMIEAGYDKKFALGLTCCAGCLGIIIPPSIPMIMYASSTGASIGTLFIGGFGPGIFLALVLCVLAYLICRRRGYHGNGVKFSWRNVAKATKDAIWALLMPVIILGGIYGGIFTPTEAAAVACIYGLVVGYFVYRGFKLKELISFAFDSAKTTGMIFFIIATASIFSWILSTEQVPVMISNAVLGLTSNKIVILLIINVLLLINGCFMEMTASTYIYTPILLPIVLALGMDPIHFGVVMVMNMAIGFITPPLGIHLFVGVGLDERVKFNDLVRHIIPQFLVLVVVLLLVTFIPGISMGLVDLFGH